MRQLGLLIVFSVAMLAGRAATAGDGCCSRCPSCDYVCEMSVDHSPEKKSCWKIEYKPVCIPKVTFPWQSRGCGCDKGKGGKGGDCCNGCNGSKLKYVKVLVKHEYECPSCKCKFTPVPCGKGYKDAGVYDSDVYGSENDVPADPPEVRSNHGVAPAPVTVGQVGETEYAVQQASAAEKSERTSLYNQIKDLLK